MLSATVIKRLEALETISKQGKRVNGLFRLLDNPILWYEAYANIYSNKGAMTPGVDGVTLDGFSVLCGHFFLSIVGRAARKSVHINKDYVDILQSVYII
jgi:hypothetical protein